MIYIETKEIAKSYGIKNLFQDLSFTICQGDKIALVAGNGSGKSTLMKILAAKETPDKGQIITSKEVRVLFFEQDTLFNKDQIAEDFLLDFIHPKIDALKLYQKALENMDLMEEAITQMEKYEAWNLESEMKQILDQLLLPNLSAKMQNLSGGQVKRLGLAKLLLHILLENGHFLLILDEPTNHLDTQMVEWLEGYINQQRVTLLMVTHDRIFLDQTCQTIWEMDQGKLHIHKGDYAQYLMNKSNRLDSLESTIDKAKNLYRKELDWMRRQPKARTSKSKSRIDAFFETQSTATQTIDHKKVLLDMQMTRLGGKILELKSVNKSYESDLKILENFTYTFQKGDRIGIIGKNGVGKSTFLNIIQGLEKIDNGSREVGETVAFGYYTQKGLVLPTTEKRVLEYVKDIAEFFPLSNGKMLSASQFLKRFLFNDDIQFQWVSKLSGGEKKRLHLLSVLFKNPNFLILDEPTNDLDLPTLSILEDFLLEYQGCLLIVSHDRYFMNRMVDRLFVFNGEGKIENFVGTYDEYREAKKIAPTAQQIKQNPKVLGTKETSTSSSSSSKKISHKEKTEKEKIEKELPQFQEKLNQIIQSLESESDYKKIDLAGKEMGQLNQKIEQLEMRWLELSELAAEST
jgi:ABC transport system ATP-binding/permease protein